MNIDQRCDLETRSYDLDTRSFDAEQDREDLAIVWEMSSSESYDENTSSDEKLIAKRNEQTIHFKCSNDAKHFLCNDMEQRESVSDESDNEQHFDSTSFSSGYQQRPQEMSSSVSKRLICDFNRLHTTPPNGVLGAPIDSNIMKWCGIVFGNNGSVWEGGIFKLDLEFTDAYPFQAPTVRFQTRLFHPNVGSNGEILLDMLGKGWTPAYDVADILVSIQRLLCNPNPNLETVVNSEANELFTHNRIEYNRRVRERLDSSLIYESRRHSI